MEGRGGEGVNVTLVMVGGVRGCITKARGRRDCGRRSPQGHVRRNISEVRAIGTSRKGHAPGAELPCCMAAGGSPAKETRTHYQ